MLRQMAAAVAVLLTLAGVAAAQPAAPDTPSASFSGFIQPQYQVDFRDGASRDRSLLRRMVGTLDAHLSSHWRAELQADFGPIASGGDRIIVKNAFIQYTGWKDRGILVMIGNLKPPFSRSLLTSSSRRALIERPFTGDRSLGSPGRAIGIKVDGSHLGERIYWSAGVVDTKQSEDPGEIRIDGAAEMSTRGNEGQMLAGRFELHPRGEVPRDQADFEDGTMRFTAGAGGYLWRNDGDTPAHAEGGDAQRVTGFELSGGLRGHRLSVDAEYEHITARARDRGITMGLYSAGSASLDKASIEAGYLIGRRIEALAAVDAVKADVYETARKRAATGLNLYVRRHDLKFSFMYRESFGDQGISGRRSRAAYLQAQFAF